MPKAFTVAYLVKEKDFDFEGGIIKVLSKYGYSCSNTREDAEVRVLLFEKKKEEEGK